MFRSTYYKAYYFPWDLAKYEISHSEMAHKFFSNGFSSQMVHWFYAFSLSVLHPYRLE